MKIFNIFANKFVTFVIGLLFVIYSLVTMINQSSVIKDNKMLLQNYKNDIVKQQEIQRQLEEEEMKIGTDEYTEEIARERLGLCKSNEKIFVDGNSD